MSEQKFTFEGAKGQKRKKESIEWLRTWCVNTADESLPRVALIGDSITEQVQNVIKRELNGKANVDYLATSYSIISPAYMGMVEKFLDDSDYALVCFNYGLHAYSVGKEDYKSAYEKVLEKITKKSKLVVVLTTVVHNKDNAEEDPESATLIRERNECAVELAKKINAIIDDAFTISVELGKDGKIQDGTHFNSDGIEKLGVNRANAIKLALGL